MHVFIKKLEAKLSPLDIEKKTQLIKAYNYFSKSEYWLAGKTFATLALKMEKDNQLRWAAEIHACAANAFANAGLEPATLSHSKTAINLFIQNHMNRNSVEFYKVIMNKLTHKGMITAANTLMNKYGLANIKEIRKGQNKFRPKKTKLPSNCPQCGAPINPLKVFWLDSCTVECNYCGISIHNQE